jgi:hypothetical protein
MSIHDFIVNRRSQAQLIAAETMENEMNDGTREALLKTALVVFGVIFFLVYPLGLVWPSGWVWHAGEGK